LRIVNAMLGKGRGGLEQALIDYNDALVLFGHEPHAVIHPEAAIRLSLEARNARWHGLPHLGAWDLVAAMRLRRLLARLRPDLCIAHGNRAMSLLRHAGAHPLIAVLPNYKMRCDGAAAVFYPTLDLKRHVQRQGVAEARLHYVPSMVSVPRSPPQRIWQEPPVIGAMGRFVAKKGFEVFLAALSGLRSQGARFRAVLAGDGPDRAALSLLVTEHGLSDVLTCPGWVHDKPAFFASIDVFCLPSHHEPFGIVLIEAMAQALPIVSTDSEGPTEILHNDVDGILVPRGDARSLAQALGELISNPKRAKEFGAMAYRNAHDTFSLPCVGARLDRAVRHVAQSVAVTA
jgi:glycosyltransferase involved in cell wall biosynthesis